jgi:flagellar hook protein FlgE
MPSFSIPLTGLESDNTSLNTIANNLANMTTTGFKAQTTNFATLFYQQLGTNGADDPLEVGSGVGVEGTETDFGAGAITTTSNATDVALNGNGFFVVNDGGSTELTRAGDFSVTNTGALVTANGASVMGYPATNGVVDTNASLSAISLPVGQTQQAQATGQVSFTANLDATSPVNTVVPATIQVYDSLGATHTVTATMTKTAQNTWSYSIAIPAADASSTSTPVNTTGSFTFDSNGNLASTTPNLASPGATVPLGAAGAALNPPSPTSLNGISFPGLTDGAAPLTFNLQIEASSGASLITQVSGTSAVSTKSQNGYPSGTYSGFTVASDGTISASYSNGETSAVAQIAVGDVANQQGLFGIGGNAYRTTLSSGETAVGVAGAGGNGTIEGDSLEGSNVDISAEFSDLIVAQRAFEANSKSITTFDTITQETINMIH